MSSSVDVDVDVDVDIKQETEYAYLVSDGKSEAWLAKSLVIDEDVSPDGTVGTFTVPEWVAKAKGLI